MVHSLAHAIRFVSFLALVFGCWGYAKAQEFDPALRRLRDSQQNEINAERQAQGARQDAARLRLLQSTTSVSEENPTPAAGGPCFMIKVIDISGFEAFSNKPEGYDHLLKSCATAADIAVAINRINAYYQAKGFITTRAYLPEQDISGGTLKIEIIPGRIEGFVYNDGRQADNRIKAAFPSGRGDLLNLRDLEQGLDNYNAPQSSSAKFQLIPGESGGGSFVQVLAKDGRRYFADLSTKNTGFETTGVLKTHAMIGVDNLAGINDQLNVGITTTPYDDRDDKYSDALSLNATVPFGNWSFGLDAGTSRYFFVLDGINKSYPVRGRTHHAEFSIDRLLMRDQVSKIFAYGELKVTRTRSFIDEHEIESQRRQLTIGTLGLRGKHDFATGELAWDMGLRFGLNAFGSYVPDKSIVNPDFRMFFGQLSYQAPIAQSDFLYKGIVSAQYTTDILPGTEQFSVGGWSNVRGFHDDNLYGDTGIYLQNTLQWTAYKSADLEVRIHGGLDLGLSKPSPLREWDQNHLIGVSFGSDIMLNDHLKLKLAVGHGADRPSDFKGTRTVGYASLDVKF